MRQTRNRFRTIALMVLGAALTVIALEVAGTGQVVVVPRPEETRFQLIASEPVAGPDGRSHVPGWSVLVFRDRKADRCYVAFKREESIAVEPGAPCAQ